MTDLRLRHPEVADGLPVWSLVRDTGVLDVNSSYAYCAHFRHFPTTSVVVEAGDGSLVGFITGYLVPDRPDVLFVWQVGVADAARGQGLATRMLRWLVDATGATWIETTVTPSNGASRALFQGLARKLETDITVGPGISSEDLGHGHEAEELHRIGPIQGRTA